MARQGICAAALAAVALAGCADDETAGTFGDDDEAVAVESVGRRGPLFSAPRGRPTRYPIVLAHGFDASPTNRWGFNGVAEALRADGHRVHVASVPPYAGVPTRARALAQHIDAARAAYCAARPAAERTSCMAAVRVNVVAHSMGGLDARYVVGALGYGARVASVTTISSPHRGSAIADALLGLLPEERGSVDRLTNALARAWGRTFTSEDLARRSDLRAALESLAEANAPAFNRQVRNDPRVYYQSWAGISRAGGGLRTSGARAQVAAACGGEQRVVGGTARADFMHLSLIPMAAVVAHGTEFRPGDGMTTVESARWGRFRGCIPADHLDEVGQPAGSHDTPSRWTGFDHRGFYRTMAFDLAAMGF